MTLKELIIIILNRVENCPFIILFTKTMPDYFSLVLTMSACLAAIVIAREILDVKGTSMKTYILKLTVPTPRSVLTHAAPTFWIPHENLTGQEHDYIHVSPQQDEEQEQEHVLNLAEATRKE
jgi:hypothetical protein